MSFFTGTGDASAFPVQRTVTPKLASEPAVINAPACILSVIPKVTSISSGLILFNCVTTLFVAGMTLLSASSRFSLAFSITSPRAARTVPLTSGSSIWTIMLPPSCRGNSTRRFIGLLHLAGLFYLAFFLFSQCNNLLHLILLDRRWEVQVEIQSIQSFSSETCRKFLFLISTFYCNDRTEQKSAFWNGQPKKPIQQTKDKRDSYSRQLLPEDISVICCL